MCVGKTGCTESGDNDRTNVRAMPLSHGAQLARGFFGRRAGKTLTKRQAALMADLLPRIGLDIDAPAPLDLHGLFEHPVGKIWLESGFGGGEHLIHRALQNPGTGFIGIEPFRNGMAKALVDIDERGLQNIRLYAEEAGALLDWLPPASLDGFYLLYPDPWPKPRHFKRRFINRDNLERIARVLKPGADFRLASDIDSYVEWAVDQCAAHGAFRLVNMSAETALEPWDGWPGTRYEEKALREGRCPRYLTFERTSVAIERGVEAADNDRK